MSAPRSHFMVFLRVLLKWLALVEAELDSELRKKEDAKKLYNSEAYRKCGLGVFFNHEDQQYGMDREVIEEND